MKLKVVFFEMENNREKSLARLIKKKQKILKQIHLFALLNGRGDVIKDTTEKKQIIQLYANKLDNLEEMDKCLEIYNLPRHNYDERV